MRNFRIWYRAHFLDYPYWRVTYKDGKGTWLLYWRETNGLAEVFGGKYISIIPLNYETNKTFI
jgi:hypothetical protein